MEHQSFGGKFRADLVQQILVLAVSRWAFGVIFFQLWEYEINSEIVGWLKDSSPKRPEEFMFVFWVIYRMSLFWSFVFWHHVFSISLVSFFKLNEKMTEKVISNFHLGLSAIFRGVFFYMPILYASTDATPWPKPSEVSRGWCGTGATLRLSLGSMEDVRHPLVGWRR